MSNTSFGGGARRRLLIYLLVDTSHSMRIDNAIGAVATGLQRFQREVMEDEFAVDTVHVALYTFDDSVHELRRLAPISDFQPPTAKELDPGGETYLSKALIRVMEDIKRDYQPGKPGRDGALSDYRPYVFLLTDARPTSADEKAWHDAREALITHRNPKINYIVTGCGDQVDLTDLIEIGHEGHVFHIDKQQKSFHAYFDWIATTTIQQSQLVLQGESRRSTRARDNTLAAKPKEMKTVGEDFDYNRGA